MTQAAKANKTQDCETQLSRVGGSGLIRSERVTVNAAHEFNITLLGFVRDGRFNIYSGLQRVVQANYDCPSYPGRMSR